MDSSKPGLGRRRWTSKQRQRLVTRFHRSKMTQRDFAARHGVGLSTLSKWLRLERDAVSTKVKFQEVRLPNPASRWPVESSAHRAGSCGYKTVRMCRPCHHCCGRCHAECHQHDAGAGRHHPGGFARQLQPALQSGRGTTKSRSIVRAPVRVHQRQLRFHASIGLEADRNCCPEGAKE